MATKTKYPTVALSIPALGSASLPMLPHVKTKEDGSTSLSFVALPPGETETGKGFRGWTVPVQVSDIGGLPETAEVTIGKGKTATVATVTMAEGTTKSGNPRRRADRSAEVDGNPYRLTVQVSETKSGDLYLIGTLIPGGGGGGLKSDGNPFAG